jgi:hypothetical protein
MANFYIKRTELHHDLIYIKNAFSDIGEIEKIDFIPKQNDKGQKYHGAIITCIRLTYSTECNNLLLQLENKQEPFAKFFHCAKYFWLISYHAIKIKMDPEPEVKSETKTETSINEYLWENDDRLDDNAMIYLRVMKRLVEKLKLEKDILELQSEIKERASMSAEHAQMQQWLYAKDRDSIIVFRDAELEWAKEDFEELESEFFELKEDFNDLLKSKQILQKKFDELRNVVIDSY